MISLRLRVGKTEWAHALAGGLSVWGADGSFAGLSANVPDAGIDDKDCFYDSRRALEKRITMRLCHS